MRELKMDEVAFFLKVEEEETPLEGNVLSSGYETVDKRAEVIVQEALNAGNIWAWCLVTIVAHWNGFEGKDTLGCCSYKNEEEFKQDEYYADMKQSALDDLNRVIADTAERLKPLLEA